MAVIDGGDIFICGFSWSEYIGRYVDGLMSSSYIKLMTREQSKYPELVEEYNGHYVEVPLERFMIMIQTMIDGGIMIKGDAKAVVLQHMAPIALLLESCFRKPEKDNKVMEMLSEHVQQFNRAYKVER